GPTKLKPRRRRSLLRAREASVCDSSQGFPGEYGRAIGRSRLEAPDISGERAEFGLDGEGVAGVVDGRGNLAAVADDAGVEQQAFDVGLVHGGDARNVET